MQSTETRISVATWNPETHQVERVRARINSYSYLSIAAICCLIVLKPDSSVLFSCTFILVSSVLSWVQSRSEHQWSQVEIERCGTKQALAVNVSVQTEDSKYSDQGVLWFRDSTIGFTGFHTKFEFSPEVGLIDLKNDPSEMQVETSEGAFSLRFWGFSSEDRFRLKSLMNIWANASVTEQAEHVIPPLTRESDREPSLLQRILLGIVVLTPLVLFSLHFIAPLQNRSFTYIQAGFAIYAVIFTFRLFSAMSKALFT